MTAGSLPGARFTIRPVSSAARRSCWAIPGGDTSWIASEVDYQAVDSHMGVDRSDHAAWQVGIGYQHRNVT